MAYDWSQFTKKIVVNASSLNVYKMFSTSHGMESWFLRLCAYKDHEEKRLPQYDEVKVGDTYKFRWFGWADDVDENGKILESNNLDRFGFTFDSNGTTEMKVLITLTEVENKTIIELKQYNIPIDEESKATWHLGCAEGWTFYLANLKSILEGGLDLRNKDENIKGVLNS